MPDVSVVIATRNREPFLTRAVASARAQRGVTSEIIVVDDGSTDATRAWLSSVAGPDLRVIPFDSPRGVSAARNAAIAEATGDWVAFLDDDDFWAPTYLQRQLESGRTAGALVLAGSAVAVARSLQPLGVMWAPSPGDRAQLAQALFKQNVIGGPSRVIVGTEALRGVGFDPRLAIIADWDLWIRLVREHRVAVTVEPLVAVTEHEHNMQIDQVDDIRAEIAYLRGKHAEYAAAEGAVIGDAGLDRWLASLFRRAGRRRAAAQTYWSLARSQRKPLDLVRGVAAAAGVQERGTLGRSHPEHPIEWLAAHPVTDAR